MLSYCHNLSTIIFVPLVSGSDEIAWLIGIVASNIGRASIEPVIVVGAMQSSSKCTIDRHYILCGTVVQLGIIECQMSPTLSHVWLGGWWNKRPARAPVEVVTGVVLIERRILACMVRGSKNGQVVELDDK